MGSPLSMIGTMIYPIQLVGKHSYIALLKMFARSGTEVPWALIKYSLIHQSSMIVNLHKLLLINGISHHLQTKNVGSCGWRRFSLETFIDVLCIVMPSMR